MIDAMSATVRLSPAHPPLWRDEHTMQLGLNDEVILRDLTPGQIDFIHALEGGFPLDAIDRVAAACELTVTEAHQLLERVAAAVEDAPARYNLAVTAVPGSAQTAHLRSFAAAAEDAGVRITEDGAVAVVITPVALVPRTTARWMADDRVHVPVIISSDAITVGPVIVPGVSACATCLALAQREADPAWAYLVTQLIDRLTPPPATLFAEAAGLVVRLLREFDASTGTSRAVTISALRPRSWSTHQPIADCGCQSPGGNVMAFAASDLNPEPTTAPEWRQRA